MSDETKNILMIAMNKQTEALRMATGLTLLDDRVHVAVMGELEKSEANDEQMEALEFSEVPVTEVPDDASLGLLIDQLYESDVVFCI
jgi:hypothetical protein